MDFYHHKDYRDILRHELSRRVRQNPNYSQGAFARDISLTPSRLSEVLSGKQGISVPVAMAIGKSLRLTEEENDFFGDLVASQHGRSRLARESAKLRLGRYRHQNSLSTKEAFAKELLSKWYYLAILQLVKVKGFVLTPVSVARILRMEIEESERALSRLSSLGVLNHEGDTYSVSLAQNGAVGSLCDEVLQRFHSQMMDISLRHPDRQSQKQVADYVIALDSKKLAELKSLLTDSVDYVVSKAEESDSKDSVYGLSVSLFPMSHELHENS